MSGSLKIGVIGANGWLGGAIVQALLDAGIVSPEHLVLSLRSGEPTRFPAARWTRDNQDLADSVDLLIVSVRPADWPALGVRAAGKLVISVMAGIGLERLIAGLGSERVVRALPNAAAEVRASFTPWIATPAISAEERRLVGRIFEACGTSAELESERELDYLTGLAGSGPAFPALLATAMMRHATAHGIDAEVARQAVTHLLVGTGRLFEKNGDDPANTVEVFLDYRGTTAAAIGAMCANGFDEAVGAGLAAAFHKSISMGLSA
ncbi:NAD(P)-binding domain-containing protein [Labrys sp. LIt4]|uniref:pyrroline-5-carboxylate reductase family protein n=1 Tax=Labrys sp. LIt4 TaxID=2821355 RepID=UPI001AE0C19A|nr:pyrroline-5-carboxylate reductase dimerization domain-containing protein [Labrys sp. LIt4]MBP0580373.1 NAD(P)-binding domain-containing protein [Labrys sp. LIt4]